MKADRGHLIFLAILLRSPMLISDSRARHCPIRPALIPVAEANSSSRHPALSMTHRITRGLTFSANPLPPRRARALPPAITPQPPALSPASAPRA